MSQDIVGIRRQVKQVPLTLRQGKLVPAVRAVVAALRLMLTTPLMKAEKEEFADILRESLDFLNNDATLRKIYPLALVYAPGEEKRLFDELHELLEVLDEEAMSEADALARAMEEKKRTALAKSQNHLEAREYDEARTVYNAITDEFPDDSKLKGDIGEQVLNAGLYEDAAKYLSDALALDPRELYLYNRLAIALRKLNRYDVAEEYYLRALPLAPDDPYLLFNIGRLYAEWGKWGKALEFGEKAHTMLPEFEEARKLAAFSRKKL